MRSSTDGCDSFGDREPGACVEQKTNREAGLRSRFGPGTSAQEMKRANRAHLYQTDPQSWPRSVLLSVPKFCDHGSECSRVS
jgi:hypothetical protein